MRAFLLAAGRGTRLGSLTEKVPKCLVPIRGEPLLDIWVRRLSEAGFREVRLNTHHLAHIVEAHVANARYPIAVTTHYEHELLGTAGTLAHHREWLATSDVLIAHADNFSMFDIRDFVKAHRSRPSKTIMTMLAFRTPTPESCGILEVDSSHILQNMWEKSREDHGTLANAAIYLTTAELIPFLDNAFDLSTDVIPRLLGQIFVSETHLTHIDIGTPESLSLAQKAN